MNGKTTRRQALAVMIAAMCLGTAADAYESVSIKATRPAGAKGAVLQAELFKPKGDGPFPAVVLMHGCGGWQPAVLGGLHSHAMYFLDRGYVVLNLDSFGTRGTSGGTVCETTARLVRALDYRTHDAFDALRYMRTLPFVDSHSVFLMGQSNGGSVAINAAKMTGRDGFRAVAAYYPWCGSLGRAKVKLTSPLIIFSGGRDDWVPAWQCRHKRAVGAKLKVIEYESAAHSFDLQIPPQRYLGKLIGYDQPATEDSRAHMLAFFNSTLASRQLAGKAPPSPDGAAGAVIALADKVSPSPDVTVDDLAALVAAWTGDSEISWFE